MRLRLRNKHGQVKNVSKPKEAQPGPRPGMRGSTRLWHFEQLLSVNRKRNRRLYVSEQARVLIRRTTGQTLPSSGNASALSEARFHKA
jgi:hypothetical protein